MTDHDIVYVTCNAPYEEDAELAELLEPAQEAIKRNIEDQFEAVLAKIIAKE